MNGPAILSKGGENEMDRIRRLFKKWVPAEEYGRTVNPGAAHHAAQQFLKSHDFAYHDFAFAYRHSTFSGPFTGITEGRLRTCT